MANEQIPQFNFKAFCWGLWALRIKRVRQAFWRICGHAWHGYFKPQHTISDSPISVILPVDNNIPLLSQAIKTYLGHVFFGAAYVHWCLKEFGPPAAEDAEEFFNGLAPYFLKCSEIFQQAPTTCNRPAAPGLMLAITRFLDKDLNAAPSLHVIIALHVALSSIKISNKYRPDDSGLKPAKKAFFDQAIRIIESTLLTKQHCVLDIAMAEAMVSMQDQWFDSDFANTVTDSMFADNFYRLPANTISEIRTTIKMIYLDLWAKSQAAGPNYIQTMIDYLHKLKSN